MKWKVTSSWTWEIQRDILALGSPVFYFLVIARALVGPFWDLANPLLVLAPVIYLISRSKLEADLYLSRALLMITVITMHYGDWKFGVFSGLIWLGMVKAASNLGRSKQQVTGGILLGAALAIVGAWIANLFS
ncbi:MAG TPA: hypothetical protein VF996_02385 [Candidatus Saccharimonadales bacterium]